MNKLQIVILCMMFFIGLPIVYSANIDIAASANGGSISCDNEQVGGECTLDIDSNFVALGWTTNTGTATAIYHFNDNYTLTPDFPLVHTEHCFRSGALFVNYSCWDYTLNKWAHTIQYQENNTACNQGDKIIIGLDCESTDMVRLYYPDDTAGHELYTKETNITNSTRAIIIYNPVVTISYPLNNQKLNNVTWPVKVNGTSTIYGGNINYTWINDTRFNNIGTYENFNFEYTGSFTDEEIFSIMIFSNSSIGIVSNDTVIFQIDLSYPGAVSNLDGNTSSFNSYHNITFQINFTDNLQIYSFNVSTPEGFSYYISGLNTTKYIYNGSINVSGYGIGTHTINAEYCDAHTSELIAVWDSEITDKDIRFNFGDDYFSIIPYDDRLIEKTEIEKKEDRYTFQYTKSKDIKSTTQSFIVYSSQPIDIIGNSKGYNGWLVIPKIKKWIDFNTPYTTSKDYKITRLHDNMVIVEISNLLLDKFTFNSAGDLNCRQATWNYTLFNTAIKVLDAGCKTCVPYQDITNQPFYLVSKINPTINLTTNISSIGSIYSGSTLSQINKNWSSMQGLGNLCSITGGTKHECTIASNNSLMFGYPRYACVAFKTLDGIEIANATECFTFNITFDVGECDNLNYNFTLINISYYDEFLFNNISANNEYELNFVSLAGSSQVSGVFQEANYHTICTDANTSTLDFNISIYGILNVQKSGYGTRIIENDLANPYIFSELPYYDLPIYLVSLGNSTEVTFTLKDSLLKTLIPGVQVKLFRNYNGSVFLVEQKITDAIGKVKFNFIADGRYTATFSKEGYSTLTYDFNPFTSISYDIFLIKSIQGTSTQTFDRTQITWLPPQWYAELNDFSITFYNPFEELNSYSYELVYPGGSTTDSGNNPNGETLSATINLTNVGMWQRIKLTWTYNTDIAGTRSQIYWYDILNSTPGNYTMMGVKDNTYGLGLLERLFIAVFTVLLIVGIGALAGNTDAGVALGLFWFVYLVIIAFIPKWSIIFSIFAAIILITGDLR